jgi:hypothetical protein
MLSLSAGVSVIMTLHPNAAKYIPTNPVPDPNSNIFLFFNLISP